MKEFFAVFFVLAGLASLISFATETSFVELIEDIPPNCRIWYDGCNACQKNKDGIMVCGNKMCSKDEITIPKCLEYEQ